MAKSRSVNEQIPPEARARAARGGFTAKADWYSGRIYKPADQQPTDDQKRRWESQAREAMARRRHRDVAAIKEKIRAMLGVVRRRVGLASATQRRDARRL